QLGRRGRSSDQGLPSRDPENSRTIARTSRFAKTAESARKGLPLDAKRSRAVAAGFQVTVPHRATANTPLRRWYHRLPMTQRHSESHQSRSASRCLSSLPGIAPPKHSVVLPTVRNTGRRKWLVPQRGPEITCELSLHAGVFPRNRHL